MWKFIIIIGIIIVLKFIYDTSNQSQKIKEEGGIKKKYSILVNHFLSGDERCQVFQDTNTMVSVGVTGPAGSQIYYIFPSFGKVSIRMEIKNNPLWGNIKMGWEFPESMDQELMIKRINLDIEKRFMKFSNSF